MQPPGSAINHLAKANRRINGVFHIEMLLLYCCFTAELLLLLYCCFTTAAL